MRIEYILLIGITLMILFLSIYIYTSTKKNEKISKVEFSSADEKKFGEIDFIKKEILFYASKNIAKASQISLEEFASAIDPNNLENWNKWLLKLQNQKEVQKTAVSVFVNRLFGYERALVKCSFKKITLGKAYVKFDLTPQINLVKSSFIGALDLKHFYRQLNEIAFDFSKPAGTLFCLNFAIFETLVTRYGPKVITPYMNKLNELVHDFKGGNMVRGHYEKDVFLFYRHGLIHQMNINSFAQKLIHHFEKTIQMEEFSFDLYPYIGILRLGEFNKNIHASVSNAFEATAKGVLKDQQITYYDADMEYKNKVIESWRYEILNVMKHKNYAIDFYSVVSLLSGNMVANLLHISYSSPEIKDYDTLYHSAQVYQLQNDLFAATLKSSLLQYLEQKKNSTLLVYCEYKNLETFEKIYALNPEFKKIDVSLIITEYEDLNLSKRAMGIICTLKAQKVTFGILAHPTMQTTIYDSLREFSFLVIPLEMIESNDERVAVMVRAILANVNVLNLQTMVFDVANYAIAERVKGFGIDYINGPLFDERNDDIISVRKISKLIEGAFDKR